MIKPPSTIAVMTTMLAGVKDGSIRGQILKDGEWVELTSAQWADFQLRTEPSHEFRVTSPTYGDVSIRLFVADLKKHMPPEGGVQ